MNTTGGPGDPGDTAVADGGRDPASAVAAGRSLWTQVKPRFMAPAVACAGFGSLIAPAVAAVPAVLHGACVALALYVAHLRDEHVDAHVRGEEAPSVAPGPLRAATVAASVSFLFLLAALGVTAGAFAVALTFPLWLIGLAHAPYLDTNPVTVSLDYPVAIGLVIAGGYVVQTGTLPGWLVWVAGSFVLVLAGATITLDRLDRAFDARIDKRTVPVVLGDERAARVAAGLVAAGGALVLAAVAVGSVPPSATLGAAVPVVASAASARATPRRATRIQMVAAYPFAALLFATTCLGVNCVVVSLLG